MAKKDFSMKGAAKLARKAKIVQFRQKYGRGDQGLIEEQKKARIEKFLGAGAEKLKGFGKNKSEGVDLFTHAAAIAKPKFYDKGGAVDQLPPDIRDKLNDYPDDPTEVGPVKKCKLLNIKIKDNGGMEIDGIVVDGNEANIKERRTWGVAYPSDKNLARLEKKQIEKGELKEVADRTMSIHEDEGELDTLLESSDIDTDEDKETQY